MTDDELRLNTMEKQISQNHSGQGDNVGNDKQQVVISGDNHQQYITQSGDIHIHSHKHEPESQKTATESTKVYENLGRKGISTEQFKGREKDLDKLHCLLQNNSQVAITAAVTGMGGVGKTELAIQYARKYLNLKTYQGGVGWFTGRDFAFNVVIFARTQFDKIFIPEGVDLREQIQACYRQWAEGEVLLVIDDVTDYNMQIKPFLPENSRFKVLLTSRLRFQNPIVPLDLEILEPPAALELLEFWVGKEKIETELENAQKICKWLGYLPLGLKLVGAYLKKYGKKLQFQLKLWEYSKICYPIGSLMVLCSYKRYLAVTAIKLDNINAIFVL